MNTSFSPPPSRFKISPFNFIVCTKKARVNVATYYEYQRFDCGRFTESVYTISQRRI